MFDRLTFEIMLFRQCDLYEMAQIVGAENGFVCFLHIWETERERNRHQTDEGTQYSM